MDSTGGICKELGRTGAQMQRRRAIRFSRLVAASGRGAAVASSGRLLAARVR